MGESGDIKSGAGKEEKSPGLTLAACRREYPARLLPLLQQGHISFFERVQGAGPSVIGGAG